LTGAEVGSVELEDAIFGIEPNTTVVHQAVLRQRANARLGTHNTKTRSEVRGGGRKPWRQKGTGRARQGSTRAPQWRHGGVVFGPHPRSYVQALPRQMRRLAVRSVLADKVATGGLLIVDSFADLEPRTKAMIAALDALQLTGRRVLIMTAEREQNLELAAGNLPGVETMLAQYMSLVAMLKADMVVLSRTGLDVIQSILGSTGGRRPRQITLTEAELELVEDSAPSPMDMAVRQMPGASEVTAAAATVIHASRGVEEAIEEEAAEFNADTGEAEAEIGETQALNEEEDQR
jgi:large subunit ribosomal protein L4